MPETAAVAATHINLLWTYGIFVILLFIIGLYCVLITYNLIRALIGVEILIKGVTLLIIVVGHIDKHLALAQEMIITLIVIEAVIMVVAMGIILKVHSHYKTLDSRNMRNF